MTVSTLLDPTLALSLLCPVQLCLPLDLCCPYLGVELGHRGGGASVGSPHEVVQVLWKNDHRER